MTQMEVRQPQEADGRSMAEILARVLVPLLSFKTWKEDPMKIGRAAPGEIFGPVGILK
jgi:hypothetical protein